MTSTVHVTQIDSIGITDLSVDVSRLPATWVEQHRSVRRRGETAHHVTLKSGQPVKVVLVPLGEDITAETRR